MLKFIAFLRLPITLMGLVLLFVTERYLSSETYHLALRVAAMVLMAGGWLLSLALAATTAKHAPGEARGWRTVGIWQLLLLAGSGAYLGYIKVVGDAATPETPAGKVLLGAWLVLTIVALATGVGSEWSMRANGRGESAEPTLSLIHI